jgi:hypothetical protein
MGETAKCFRGGVDRNVGCRAEQASRRNRSSADFMVNCRSDLVGCKYSIDWRLRGFPIIVVQDAPQPLTAANDIFA